MVNGQPIQAKEFEKLKELIWARIPEADRPSAEEQRLLTCSKLQGDVPVGPRGQGSIGIHGLPRVRLANGEESDRINPNLGFGFVPNSMEIESQELLINGGAITVEVPTHDVVFATESDVERITGNELDPIYWSPDFKGNAKILLDQAVATIRIHEMAEVVRAPEILFHQPVPGIFEGVPEFLRLYNDVRHISTTLNLSVDYTESLNPFCELIEALKQMSLDIEKDPQGQLEKLDRQEIVGHLRFFQTINRVSQIKSSISNDVWCGNGGPVGGNQGNMSQGYTYPLRGVLNLVVLRSLDSTRFEVVVRPPRIVSEVTLVSTFENVKEPPPQARAGEKSPDQQGSEDRRVLKIEVKPSEQAALKFELRSETLLGLLMNAGMDDLKHPAVQALVASYWTEDFQKYYMDAWSTIEGADARLLALWHWSPLLGRTEWMPASFKERFNEVFCRPGHYMTWENKGKESNFSYVPNWLSSELAAAIGREAPGSHLKERTSAFEADKLNLLDKEDKSSSTCSHHNSDFSSLSDNSFARAAQAAHIDRDEMSINWSTLDPCRYRASGASLFNHSYGEQLYFVRMDAQAQTLHYQKQSAIYELRQQNRYNLNIPIGQLKEFKKQNP